MKNLKKVGQYLQTKKAVLVGSVLALSATASQAAFDPLTIAAEKADYIANVEVAVLIGVTFALVGAGGLIILKFIRRGSN